MAGKSNLLVEIAFTLQVENLQFHQSTLIKPHHSAAKSVHFPAGFIMSELRAWVPRQSKEGARIVRTPRRAARPAPRARDRLARPDDDAAAVDAHPLSTKRYTSEHALSRYVDMFTFTLSSEVPRH